MLTQDPVRCPLPSTQSCCVVCACVLVMIRAPFFSLHDSEWGCTRVRVCVCTWRHVDERVATCAPLLCLTWGVEQTHGSTHLVQGVPARNMAPPGCPSLRFALCCGHS
jgi:hypothetical protein